MADYERKILVPYLQDVCCAEMVIRKLEKDISKYKAEADKYTKWANDSYTDPKRPNRCEYEQADASGGVAIFAIIIVVGFALFSIPFIGAIIGIGAILYGLIGLFTCISENNEIDRRVDKKYREALENYNKQLERNKGYRNSIPGWKATAEKWREQEKQARKNLADAKKMREKLYAVNIIPSRYRNIHAAYYLYDFFESGRSTDLEQTIQTMLLDEIVQRMDTLIAQNQELILNQRMQIALTENQNRVIANNHREEMKRIAKMEANQERQLDYQRMIEANQEVTNFFLATDFIERHR